VHAASAAANGSKMRTIALSVALTQPSYANCDFESLGCGHIRIKPLMTQRCRFWEFQIRDFSKTYVTVGSKLQLHLHQVPQLTAHTEHFVADLVISESTEQACRLTGVNPP